jgi:hypothetical protein
MGRALSELCFQFACEKQLRCEIFLKSVLVKAKTVLLLVSWRFVHSLFLRFS